MGIKKYNPTTPGLRGMTVSTFEEIIKTEPEKAFPSFPTPFKLSISRLIIHKNNIYGTT